MKHPLLAFVVVLFLACDSKENENVDYKAQNEQDITAYIADKNLNAQKSDSGLYYVINEEGTGEHGVRGHGAVHPRQGHGLPAGQA